MLLTPRRTPSHILLARPTFVRTLATSSPTSPPAPTADEVAKDLLEIRRFTEEEQNQWDWWQFDEAKKNLYVFGAVIGAVLLVRYWYRRERDHFLHHRHQQEPYAFFINRDDQVAAGFWPGRSCQFLEFNCYAAVYDTAEKMLKEKKAAGAEGAKHDDKHGKH